jgi:L-aspartate oxidase
MRRYGDCVELAPRDIVARDRHRNQKTRYRLCVSGHQPATHAGSPCGVVLTDKDSRTDIPGLFAIGEVVCTGLHGANRMASNSLLVCLVFAEQAKQDIGRQFDQLPESLQLPIWDESQVGDFDEEVVIAYNWE